MFIYLQSVQQEMLSSQQPNTPSLLQFIYLYIFCEQFTNCHNDTRCFFLWKIGVFLQLVYLTQLIKRHTKICKCKILKVHIFFIMRSNIIIDNLVHKRSIKLNKLTVIVVLSSRFSAILLQNLSQISIVGNNFIL